MSKSHGDHCEDRAKTWIKIDLLLMDHLFLSNITNIPD